MLQALLDALIENSVSAISALMAIVSAVYARYSVRVAKNALKIAQNDFDNRQSNFETYFVDSYRILEGNSKTILINLSLNNRSDTGNSFTFKLEIEYVSPDLRVERIVIDHQPELLDLISRSKITPFNHPHNIASKTAESKWLLFKQPENVFKEHKINKYTVKVIDVKGVVSTFDIYLMKSVRNETSNSQRTDL